MLYAVAAEFMLLLHAAFILFAVAGGLPVLRWRWLMWLHLPAAMVAPLSPLNRSQLREPLERLVEAMGVIFRDRHSGAQFAGHVGDDFFVKVDVLVAKTDADCDVLRNAREKRATYEIIGASDDASHRAAGGYQPVPDRYICVVGCAGQLSTPTSLGSRASGARFDSGQEGGDWPPPLTLHGFRRCGKRSGEAWSRAIHQSGRDAPCY